MTLDQHLLERASAEQQAFVRLYQWDEPTLSLGYFQRWQDRQTHIESLPLPVVRRSTGGGAIVHQHEWTYSVAVPSPRKVKTSLGAAQPVYDSIHQEVVRWLSERGLEARTADASTCAGHDCHFLCFHRRSVGDVIVGDHKIMGSAQRRHQDAVLQHGSLLLSRSEFAPSLPGLEQLDAEQASVSSCGVLSDKHAADFAERLASATCELLGAKLHKKDYSDPLFDFRSVPGRFGEQAWTMKR